MTVYTTQTLVSAVTHGAASGNYDGSSQDWYSDAVPAANYYGGQGALQTATYNLAGFVGVITIEATLNDTKASAPWFSVATYGNGVDPDSGITPTNIVGNFTWLRVHVTDFEAGTINLITAAY
jgi:hypothetical protein